MSLQDQRQGASYGLSVAVAFGWYATVLAALIIGARQTTTGHECDNATSWCFAPDQGIVFALMIGSPALLGLAVATVLVAMPIARWVPSAPLAGTLAAACAALLTAAVTALFLAAR